MYKISVPITNSNIKRAGRDTLLSQLKRMNAERVFLTLVSRALASVFMTAMKNTFYITIITFYRSAVGFLILTLAKTQRC